MFIFKKKQFPFDIKNNNKNEIEDCLDCEEESRIT